MEKSYQLFQVLQKTGFIIGCLFLLWIVIIILQFIRETFTIWIERLNKKYPEPHTNAHEKDITASGNLGNSFRRNSQEWKGNLKKLNGKHKNKNHVLE